MSGLLALTPWGLLPVAVVVAAANRGVPWRLPWRSAISGPTVPILLVAAVAIGIAVVATYYLPVWQWDAVGYHLPLVNFVLQRGRFADIPPDVPYVSTHPHAVEYMFIAWRAMLPDERLVELAGIPLGLMGALAVAYTSTRLPHSAPARSRCSIEQPNCPTMLGHSICHAMHSGLPMT